MEYLGTGEEAQFWKESKTETQGNCNQEVAGRRERGREMTKRRQGEVHGSKKNQKNREME